MRRRKTTPNQSAPAAQSADAFRRPHRSTRDADATLGIEWAADAAAFLGVHRRRGSVKPVAAFGRGISVLHNHLDRASPTGYSSSSAGATGFSNQAGDVGDSVVPISSELDGLASCLCALAPVLPPRRRDEPEYQTGYQDKQI
jgi:hypothetical protein